MTKTPDTVTETEAPEARNNTKRQFAAVATSTAVTVVLGVAANVAIAKISGLVQERINPTPKPESE